MPTSGSRSPRLGEGHGRALRFHPLTFLDEGEDVVVGRPDLDSYVVLPADGAALLRRLHDGAGTDEAASWYATEFGEPVDVDDFVDSLHQLGFLRDDDDPTGASGHPGPGDGAGPASPVRYQRLGAAVFSAPASIAYLAVVLTAGTLVAVHPELAPRHEHVFFSDSLVVVELSLFVLQFPLVLVHELAHVLAGRRLGLRTRLRVSRRLHFLVFETVLNGLVGVPRRQRVLPMLAGMLADLVLAATLTVAAWLVRCSVPDIGWLAGLCLALALTTLLRMVWQLYFFLRTDLYYLLTTVLGCVDLQTVSRQYLLNAVNRRLGRVDRLVPEESWHPRDRRAARWYAPLLVLGYATAVGLLIAVMLPIAWRFLSTAVERVFLGDALSGRQFWDATILLGLNVAQLVAAGVLALRERGHTTWPRRERSRPAIAPAVADRPADGNPRNQGHPPVPRAAHILETP